MTPEAEAVLNRLYAEDEAQRVAGLASAQRTRNVGRETGCFLFLQTRVMRAESVLEIGSSNGVSTIWLALGAAKTGGRVVGTEILWDRAAEANANLAEASLGEAPRVMPGDARRTIRDLGGTFDLVFVDAEKDDYVDHFLAAIDRVRIGGLVLADNVVSHDLSAYQAMLRARPDVETLTLPLERGLEYTLKAG